MKVDLDIKRDGYLKASLVEEALQLVVDDLVDLIDAQAKEIKGLRSDMRDMETRHKFIQLNQVSRDNRRIRNG